MAFMMGKMYHRPGDSHYHSDRNCPIGEAIPIDDRETGDAGLLLCPKCASRRKQRGRAKRREDIARGNLDG